MRRGGQLRLQHQQMLRRGAQLRGQLNIGTEVAIDKDHRRPSSRAERMSAALNLLPFRLSRIRRARDTCSPALNLEGSKPRSRQAMASLLLLWWWASAARFRLAQIASSMFWRVMVAPTTAYLGTRLETTRYLRAPGGATRTTHCERDDLGRLPLNSHVGSHVGSCSMNQPNQSRQWRIRDQKRVRTYEFTVGGQPCLDADRTQTSGRGTFVLPTDLSKSKFLRESYADISIDKRPHTTNIF